MKKTILHCILILNFLNLSAQNGGVWTWIHGDSTVNSTGSYGTKGVAAASNVPSARYQSAYWQDFNDDFWMFSTSHGSTADMWKYNSLTNQWTWMSGSSTNGGASGSYGTKGIPSVNNYPRQRGFGASCWVDSIGDLWLYGGWGGTRQLNDLWRFRPSTLEWTWVGGDNPNLFGNSLISYGTKNVSSTSNFPGTRTECRSNYLNNNELILFSGGGSQNDIWKYSIHTNMWTWIGGDSIYNQYGSYGTKGIASFSNRPPSSAVPIYAYSYTKWKANEKIYMYGGVASSSVWSFDLSTGLFTWEHGPNSNATNSGNNPSNNCLKGVNYYPSSRFENQSIQTSQCNKSTWMFGGFASANSKTLCDLWLYDIDSNSWMRVSGDSTESYQGNYGTKGVQNSTNHPPGLGGMAIWNDANGNLFIFGGLKSGTSLILSNNLWRFEPDKTCIGSYKLIGNNIKTPAKKVICSSNDSVVMTLDTIIYSANWSPKTNVTVNSDTTRLVFRPTVETSYIISSFGGLCKPIDTIIFTIHVGQHTYDTIYDTTCNLNKYPYTSNGVYTYIIRNRIGCDSIINLHLTFDSSFSYKIIDTTIECGDTFKYFNYSYIDTGKYILKSIDSNGCESYLEVTLHAFLKFGLIKTINTCYNGYISLEIGKVKNYLLAKYSIDSGKNFQSFNTFDNLSYGIYHLAILTRCGRIDTTIELGPVADTTNIFKTICARTNYFFNAQNRNQTGIYWDTFTNVNSCDSFIRLSLTVLKDDTTRISFSKCLNDSLIYMDSVYKSTGIYWRYLKNSAGCDSIIRLDLQINDFVTSKLSIGICRGQSYLSHSQTGVYFDTFRRTGLCDSIRELDLVIYDTTSFSFTQLMCPQESYFFNNQSISTLGIYKDTLVNSNGCDSFVYLTLARSPAKRTSISKTICHGPSYKGRTKTMVFLDTMKTKLGCDSIETVSLSVLSAPYLQNSDIAGCTQVYFNSKIYFQSAVVRDTLKNYLGCDSVFRTNYIRIKSKPSVIDSVSVIFCDSIRSGCCLITMSVYKIDTLKTKDSLSCDSAYRPTRYIMKQTTQMAIRSYPYIDEYNIGDEIELRATIVSHYIWSTNETSQKIKIKINSEDNYYNVIGWNDPECKDTAEILIKANDWLLDFPKGFAPDGMAGNRVFKPDFKGKLEITKFEVYNRWGEKVYAAYNTNNVGWDGAYRDVQQEMGMYSYMIEYTANRKKYFKTGEVLLVR